MGRVVVVGSANVDHVVRVDRLPRPGESVLGAAYAEHMGGKGANQAVAAARLGAAVVFLGAVGRDAAGDRAFDALTSEGIECGEVARPDRVATGAAVITVDNAGENQIAVAPGANQFLDPEHVAARVAELRPAVVLAVLEVSMAAVLAAGRAARSIGARLVLNASPAGDLPRELLELGPCITVNSQELAGGGSTAETLLERGASAVVVTRGADGVLLRTTDGDVEIPGERPGRVVDATGAGDTFAGGLAAFLAEGIELEQAARMANAAAGLSVLREGARGGMPSRSELEGHLRRSPSV